MSRHPASATNWSPSLHRDLTRFAALRRVLVALDFDGTLAPLVDEPMAARALPGSIAVLNDLARMPGTTVAIVSGRALATLATLSGASAPVLLVGSHGLETSFGGSPPVMDDAERARFEALDADLQDLRRAHPLARIERKPHSLVLHTRGLPPEAESAAVRAGQALASRHTDLVVTPGKGVLEMATQHVGKGSALRELAADRGAEAVLFAGDDVTDEQAFDALGPNDLTIKVGAGATRAAHALTDEQQVLELVRELLRLRRGPRGGQDLPETETEPGGPDVSGADPG